MKKFVMGVIVGALVATTGSVFADDIANSLVGKTIDGSFPVKISGKQLDVPAAVIEGTSYLPVRAIGDALNMEVSFDADLGIELKTKGGKEVSGTKYYDSKGNLIPEPKVINETPVETEKEKEYYQKYNDLSQQLFPINQRFLELETIIKDYRDGTKVKDAAYEAAVKENDELKVKLEEIYKQIAEPQK